MASSDRRLRVERMSPRAQNWLRETRQAFVQYSFERVIDLINPETEILAVASHEVGAGPFSLVLEQRSFPQDIRVESPVLVFENGLWLGDWLIDAEEAEIWNPVPQWQLAIAGSGSREWVARLIREELTHHAELDSLARLILNPIASSPLPAKIFQAAEQNIPLLFASIKSGDSSLLRNAAKGLAGLGPGLTPAGDDLLLGAMFGIWATRAQDEARSLTSIITKASVPRTHVLSAAWLEAAAEGEAAEDWHALFDAIHVHNEAAVRGAVSRILPTGHTSGSDALGGFLGVLETINS